MNAINKSSLKRVSGSDCSQRIYSNFNLKFINTLKFIFKVNSKHNSVYKSVNQNINHIKCNYIIIVD